MTNHLEILRSKKFQAALIGLIVALVGEIGLNLDTEALITVLSPVLTYILGQAVADAGKERAKVENGK